MSLFPTIANGLLFNISWFAIVYTHSTSVALLITTAHLVVHFLVFGRGLLEARFIAGVGLLGIVLDQLLFFAGVFTIGGQASLAPLWISCLWLILATTLMHAFSSLQQKLMLAGVFGAIGGAASYIAGTRLSDIEFAYPTAGPLIMGAIWLIVFPLLLWVAHRQITAHRKPEGAQTDAN